MLVLATAWATGLGAAGVAQAASADPGLSLARAEAARVLGAVPLPSGTAPLATDPYTGTRFAPPGPPERWQVLAAGHWLAPVPAQAARSYLSSHQPPGATQVGMSFVGGPLNWGETLTFPVSGAAVTSARLDISVSPYGRAQAEIDATAQVLWKPSWEEIPGTTRAVTVSVDRGPAVAVAGRRRIAALARLFARLSTVTPDLPSCPSGVDPQTAVVRLTGARRRVLATLRIDDRGECNQVFVRLGRRRGAPLWDHGLLDLLWRERGVNACRAGQLAGTVTSGRHDKVRSLDIEMHNTSRTECSVDGYPRLRLLTPQRRGLEVIVTRDRRQSSASLATAAPGEVLVVTASWPKRRFPCARRTVDAIAIRLPGVSGELNAPTDRPLSICAGPIATSAVYNPGPSSRVPPAVREKR